MEGTRYMVVYGVMLAKDGFENIVSREAAEKIKVNGMHVYEINEPDKQVCLLFSSMTPVFSSKAPVCVFGTNSISRAESFVLGMFMLQLDPERKLGIRCASYFVDTVEARVRVVHEPSAEEAAAVKKKYAKARVGDSPEEIKESREIRKAARLGTTDFPKSGESGAPQDPEDKSGLSGELELYERAESMAEKRKEEKYSKSANADFVGSLLKQVQERIRPKTRRPPKFRVVGYGLQQRPRRVQGPMPGKKDFRPILQPAEQTQITEPKSRPKYDGSVLPSKIRKCEDSDYQLCTNSDDEIISDGDLFGDDDCGYKSEDCDD